MPRVHFVRSARKDNPAVKAGESYYWWKFRHGGKRYSKSRPRPSQLTQSDKLSRAYALAEQVEDIDLGLGAEVATNELEDVANDARELAEEYRESGEAIRETFAESPTADECDEKADALEQWADEIEEAAQAVQATEDDDELGHAIDQVSVCPL